MGVRGYKSSICLSGSKTTMLEARRASGNVNKHMDYSGLGLPLAWNRDTERDGPYKNHQPLLSLFGYGI